MCSLLTRGSRRAAIFSLLTLIGLVAAPSVQAQLPALGSGDRVTVSDAGTVGIIGGVPINSNISAYSIFGSGGTVVQTSGTAAFTMAGGSLFSPSSNTDIFARGSGPVTISGGSIGVSHGSIGLYASGTGSNVVSGGIFRGDQTSTSIYVTSGAAVQVTGGDFSSAAPFGVGSGGTLYLFSKNDTPFTVTGIPGQPFSGTAYNNTSLNLASLGANQFANFGISGILMDGEGFNVNLSGLGTVDFNLPAPAAVPESSTTTSFGLLLMLGAGGLALAKRRRAVIAPPA